MDIRAAEISDIIRHQIENYDKKVSVTETGTVLTAGDGIAKVGDTVYDGSLRTQLRNLRDELSK